MILFAGCCFIYFSAFSFITSSAAERVLFNRIRRIDTDSTRQPRLILTRDCLDPAVVPISIVQAASARTASTSCTSPYFVRASPNLVLASHRLPHRTAGGGVAAARVSLHARPHSFEWRRSTRTGSGSSGESCPHSRFTSSGSMWHGHGSHMSMKVRHTTCLRA